MPKLLLRLYGRSTPSYFKNIRKNIPFCFDLFLHAAATLFRALSRNVSGNLFTNNGNGVSQRSRHKKHRIRIAGSTNKIQSLTGPRVSLEKKAYFR